MAKILLDYSDGHYSTRPLGDEEATKLEAQGFDVEHIEDRVLDAWHRHCDQEGTWQALWRSISNERYVRRREKELMPLEAAEREINRLKEELARAKRMETLYENQYVKNLGDRHREEHVEFTCVYPQPGCSVDELPEEWLEDAQEILEHYKPDRVKDGLKYQGCCCGHKHKLLDDAEAQKLRDAGFIVENDTETL